MLNRSASLGKVCLLALGLLLTGCSQSVVQYVVRGEYGQAREFLRHRLPSREGNRNYILRRMSLCLVDLADGLPESAEPTVNQTYDMLRRQGLNEDRTVACVVTSENVKIWKGEPFEQALMYCYIAIQKALRNDWDNARAATTSSLFLLKDFGENQDGERKNTQEIAEAAVAAEGGDEDADYIDNGYVAIETSFALGYLMSGVMSAAMGRDTEAADNFEKAVSIDARLRPVTRALRSDACNAVLVADYGLGPRKVNYGPDGVFAKFVPCSEWPSDDRPLVVSVNHGRSENFPPACDLNQMAMDHTWVNMEEVRIAKSVIGTALVGAGASYMARTRSASGLAIGAVIMLAGAGMKASARADTRHCDIMPQRVYVASVQLDRGENTIELQVYGDETSRMILPAIRAPDRLERWRLIYVRMTPNKREPPLWATAGRVLYANDACAQRVTGDDLPYILGGRCVCRPSSSVLARYQAAGYLQDLTLVDLENLYRDEGIMLSLDDEENHIAGRHILEGGNSLACPQAGSAGFLRLFCQEKLPYQPKCPAVAALAQQIQIQRGPVVARDEQ